MEPDDEPPLAAPAEPHRADRQARWWEAWLTLIATFVVAAVAFYLASLGN